MLNQLIENKSKKTLIIFTRYPEAGKTKTRLIPVLGAKKAAELQQKMTEKTVEIAYKLSQEISIKILIYFTGGNKKLMENWLGKNLIYHEQVSGDLGIKMLSAFEENLSEKNNTIIIGVDCPDLNEKILQEAFTALEMNDLVIGQAEDGGYYLIGLKKAESLLFLNINWGTCQVFQETIEKAKILDLSIYNLPILRDIDRPEDLKFG